MNTSVADKAGPTPVRWHYLLAGAAGMLFSGIIYAWSILKTPMMDAFGWSPSQMALNYTLTIGFFCLGSVVGGVLVRRVPAKLLLGTAGVLVFAGFLLSSCLGGGSVLPLYLSYGVLIGLGIGIAYNTLLSVTGLWFPDQKGVCSGTLMMCFGWSTMLLGQVASRLFSVAAVSWRGTFRILGLLALLIFLLCAAVLRKPPPEVDFPRHTPGKEPALPREEREYTTGEVLRRPTFWVFYAYGMLGATVGSVVISFARDLALSVGASAYFATTLVGILSIFNGMGRIACGIAFDRYGRRRTMLGIGILTVAAPSMMLPAIVWNSLPLATAAFCLTGLSYGCYPTISASVIASFYGGKNFSVCYSISNTKLLASSLASVLTTMLFTQTGSYVAPFLMLLSFSVAALLLQFLIRRP